MSWRIWRIVTDKRINATLSEIYEHWRLEDLYEAHDVLNALDEFERQARAKEGTT